MQSRASSPLFRPCQHVVSIGSEATMAAHVFGAWSQKRAASAVAVLPSAHSMLKCNVAGRAAIGESREVMKMATRHTPQTTVHVE